MIRCDVSESYGAIKESERVEISQLWAATNGNIQSEAVDRRCKF